MSKKYRLFREFPGSPDYGTVVLKGSSSDPNPELYADEKNIFFFTVEQVENYPEFWEEIKEPLFTTYDNVELYEGDTYYCVHRNEDGTISGEIAELNNIPYPFNSSVPVFAKKLEAEKYIRDNEKKYSLKDIKEIVEKLDCFGTTLIEYLENNSK